jgi:uncharacterized membrane protein (UPF0127 family)
VILFRRLILLYATVACLTGCKEEQSQPPVLPQTQVHGGLTGVIIHEDTLWVKIAADPEARERGLMFRQDLPEDEGMLFVFDYPQPLSFWMKNTYLPLDIAFVSADKHILNILAMKPLDEKTRYESQGPAQYAIEVNRGWFVRHGVSPGDRVQF